MHEITHTLIILFQGKVTLTYLTFDERLPQHRKECASVAEALCDIYVAGEHTGALQLAMVYITDHLEA